MTEQGCGWRFLTFPIRFLRPTTFTDDVVKEQVRAEVGIRPPFALESFVDVDDDLRQSVARILASPFIPHKGSVRGFVYEVEKGTLREVL